jgi:hypothetical protein
MTTEYVLVGLTGFLVGILLMGWLTSDSDRGCKHPHAVCTKCGEQYFMYQWDEAAMPDFCVQCKSGKQWLKIESRTYSKSSWKHS